MVKLKHSEMRIIDDAFATGSGYVLDFSNKTFAEFFDDDFGIDIYAQKYDYRGGSKANHLRALIEAEDDYTVGRVLRRLYGSIAKPFRCTKIATKPRGSKSA